MSQTGLAVVDGVSEMLGVAQEGGETFWESFMKRAKDVPRKHEEFVMIDFVYLDTTAYFFENGYNVTLHTPKSSDSDFNVIEAKKDTNCQMPFDIANVLYRSLAMLYEGEYKSLL